MTNDIHDAVRDRYARIAVEPSSCCAPGAEAANGYTAAELADLPDGSILGLGCGNPAGFAEIRQGDTVVDLGSGGGIDAFLAAKKTGTSGLVIGVDMTPEMVERATGAAADAGIANVEFRLGLIEELPIDGGSVDLILSNCVINLSPDKGAVFAEAFRVLRPGGRLVVSDIVSATPPDESDLDGWTACVSGAIAEEAYLGAIVASGFGEVEVLSRRPYSEETASITVRAVRAA